MFYIILNILCSVALLFIFKVFDKYKVNTFHAIIFNYLSATATGLLFSKNDFDFSVLLNSTWTYISIPLGVLLISVFYLISLTTQKISISTASVANKMSVAMPVLFSILVLHESLTPFKSIGIICAFVALYLATNSNPDSNPDRKKIIYLPISVFIGSGLVDVAINACNAFFIKSNQDSEMFTITSFAFAFIIGLAALLFNYIKSSDTERKSFIKTKSIVAGFILGIPNYFSIFFILKSLESKVLTGVQLFPVLNISNVILATLTGYFVFREKLNLKNITGIIIALAAIILITI